MDAHDKEKELILIDLASDMKITLCLVHFYSR